VSWFKRTLALHQDHRLEIFWTVLFFFATGLVFGERFYTYNIEREIGGLRRILNYGVSVTRGAASTQMFAYSVVLLPVCRNIITILSNTVLAKYIPFERAYEFHVLVGITGGVFTLMHVIGHFFNFYNIATQSAADLAGIFRSIWWTSDFLPTFAWWLFGTVTGMTGVLLTFVCINLFVFSVKRVRKASYALFWPTHHISFTLLYILTVLHGSYQLIQKPIFQYFLSVPLALFILDKVIAAAHSARLLRIEDARVLPSGTVALYIEKPLNLLYRPGQYARLQIVQLGRQEFHPFTISSAPYEKHVSFHIQAVGPWTNALRDFVKESENRKYLPRCRMDGPYGDGFENWSSFETILLVGSGLGVTPFMSMLKNIAHQCRTDALNARTRKIYCVFILRRLREFQWLTELIREVEEALSSDMLEMIFYATATRSNDFRFMFLRYFAETSQQFAARSALTNTRGFSLFGRPDFSDLLTKLNVKVMEAKGGSPHVVGVYSCGAPDVTSRVNSAVRVHNDLHNSNPSQYCRLKHHYQSFS